MNKQQLWVSVGFGMIALLLVGILLNSIGNVSIRSNDSSISRIAVHAINPLNAGSHTVIRWDTPSSVASQQVSIVLRSTQGEAVLTNTTFFAGTASIQIPCTTSEGSASLEIMSTHDKSVIAWTSVAIT